MDANHWSVNMQRAVIISTALHTLANITNDSHDRDELNAAGQIVMTCSNRGIIPGDYIVRWVDGLLS